MRCFLSYSFDTDISVIKRILTENNVHYVSPVDSLEYGDNITTTVRRQLQDSDFVVGILDHNNNNVFFEIGMAVALKKPIFILLKDNRTSLPIDASELTYTISESTDYEKINYSFRIFIDNLSRSHSNIEQRKPKVSTKKIKGKTISRNLASSLMNRPIQSAQQFEQVIGDLFREMGVGILAENKNKARDFQADFSLWIDELNSSLGNPIIVEVKFNRNRDALKGAVDQLSNYLKKYNSKTGLLIYNNPSGVPFTELYSYSPLILSISFQDLVDKVTTTSFAETILKLRNQIVHRESF